VFEFSAGGELFTLVKKRGKLSEETAKFYFCEIALALQYLHETLQVVFR
jgi:serine/threonine protein kinase